MGGRRRTKYLPNAEGEGRGLVVHGAHFNARRRHLEKYIALWHSFRCDVLLCITGTPVDAFRPRRGLEFAEAVLGEVRDLQANRPTPILLCTFSGSSKTLYWPMTRLLKDASWGDVRSRIVGQLFDSCPIEFRADEGLDLLTKTDQNPFLNAAPALLKPLITAGLRLFAFSLDTVMASEIRRQHQTYWADITSESPLRDVKTLVVYSPKDKVVKHATILKFVRTLGGLGCPVTAHEFTGDSHHVDHVVKEPGKYREACSSLFDSVGLTSKL